MSGKRQQMRNEHTLQELVKTVPGNNTCADCFARNPAWASWSLGIFLCMRCAGLHRKLGTHISKVKSLSMDSWTKEQVEVMKRTGNVASNRIYNPTNAKPSLPLDVDEADGAMERFVRQKYLDKDLSGTRQQRPRTEPTRRHDTGSTASDDRNSPPLPPLPPKSSGGRFGFASAISFKSSKSKKMEQFNAQEAAWSPSPPMASNKPSRVFGSSVGESTSGLQELEAKLEKMRDMGFLDEKRNLTVLKGLGGNLEKSIETLVRLGEGTKPVLPPRPKHLEKETSGISFERSPTRPQTTSQTHSKNPFDIPAPQPQSTQSTGNVNGSNPYHQALGLNPFGAVASHSEYDINQAFQNMSVSNSASQSQTLFPHRTGGFPSQYSQHEMFLPSLETCHPAVPQQYPSSAITPYSSIYDFQQPQQQNFIADRQQQTYNNPFLQQSQPVANANGNHSANPFLHHASTFPVAIQQQPTNPYSQQQLAQQQQVPQQQYQQLQQSQQQPTPQQMYDWTQPQPPQTQQQQWAAQLPQNQALNQPQAMYQQQPQDQQQFAPQPQYQYHQPQPLMSQQTGRANKTDIMALYNYPQLAPSMPIQNAPPQNPNKSQLPNTQFQHNGQQQQNPAAAAAAAPQFVNSGSNNPFMTSNGGNGGGGEAGKQSRESIMAEGGGWMNGRHSPDAFASLSTVQTRSMR